jgi:hypothetical protein
VLILARYSRAGATVLNEPLTLSDLLSGHGPTDDEGVMENSALAPGIELTDLDSSFLGRWLVQ